MALVLKTSLASAENITVPKLGRSPGGGHGNSLQYSCLENSMDREEKLGRLQFMGSQRDMTEQLSTAQVITSQE